jgi:dTDP-4-dehydrorhamnose 3,5-epimerase-like enzyme
MVGILKRVHEDDRRVIFEFDKGSNFSVQLFQVKATDLPLGKHAHGKKTETFTLIAGNGYVLICRVDEAGNQIGTVERHELTGGSVVRVEPLEAHTFYLAPKSVLHNYSSTPFDVEDFIPTPFLVG